jgi:hypothetical protein
MRKPFATMVAVAVAASALLGGVALADTGGSGTGGTATDNCVNVGIRS